MNSDWFSSLMLCPSIPKTTGKEFRPQLRGVIKDEYYLLDEFGKQESYFDSHFDNQKLLTQAWISLHNEHTESIAQKAWIISALLSAYSFDEVHEDFLPLLEIPTQQHIFKMYRDIGSKLGKEFLNFAHEKQFSLKQCQSFVLMPQETLESLLEYKEQLNLSASHFLELSELLSDYCRKTNVSAANLLKKPPFTDFLNNDSLTLHSRTELFKSTLKELRLPTLTTLNKHMSSLVDTLNLPQQVSINWDKTLENPGIDLSVKLTSKDELATFVSYLNNPDSLSGMSDMLELQ